MINENPGIRPLLIPTVYSIGVGGGEWGVGGGEWGVRQASINQSSQISSYIYLEVVAL